MTFNLVKVEGIQISHSSHQTVERFRVGNISQKFKTVKFLHKDKINAKMFETVLEYTSVGFLISILRCVICLVRRSRRIKSSLTDN